MTARTFGGPRCPGRAANRSRHARTAGAAGAPWPHEPSPAPYARLRVALDRRTRALRPGRAWPPAARPRPEIDARGGEPARAGWPPTRSRSAPPCCATTTRSASGRLILLHDPAGHEAWEGTLRLVTYVTAELDAEMATDPLLPEVGWSWLTDALDHHAPLQGGRRHRHPDAVDPVRRPVRHAAHGRHRDPRLVDPGRPRTSSAHLDAWCALLASTAGLPPPGVVALPGRLGLAGR